MYVLYPVHPVVEHDYFYGPVYELVQFIHQIVTLCMLCQSEYVCV